MTCDQMNAEMMTAGMQMNAQLDQEGLLAENQAMQEEAERRRSEQMSNEPRRGSRRVPSPASAPLAQRPPWRKRHALLRALMNSTRVWIARSAA